MYAQNRGADLFDHLPDLDLVVGTQKFHRVSYVDSLIDRWIYSKRIVAIEDEEDPSEIKDHLDTEIDNPPRLCLSCRDVT